MGRWTRLLLVTVVAWGGCAQGGGSGPGGTGRGDGSTMDGGGARDAGARPDAPITTRPDSFVPRRDAGTGCPSECMLPNASSSCVGDRCVVDSCDPGFDDCDGDDVNGCETRLDTPSDCGACGNACSFDHGTAECVGGACSLGACEPGWGDCNGVEADGCETALDTADHCGACDNACAGGAACEGGSCSMVSCPEGTSNCDGDETTGCETDHTAYANSCTSAENFGSAGGDVSCGFLCPGASFSPWVTREGNGGEWFRARVVECSSCPADIYHCFTLEVPAGVDYDLVAYSECGTVLGSLPQGPGTTEEFCVTRADGFSGDDDSFDYWLEVQYRSGSSCFDWRLTVESTSCTC